MNPESFEQIEINKDLVGEKRETIVRKSWGKG